MFSAYVAGEHDPTWSDPAYTTYTQRVRGVPYEFRYNPNTGHTVCPGLVAFTASSLRDARDTIRSQMLAP